MTLNDVIQLLLRKKSPINFLDFSIIAPISRVFGLDRGTPIDRYYVEKFLQKNSVMINGHVLEVGDSHYSKRFGGKQVDVFEVLNASDNTASTITGDLTDATTLPENKIDCFICTQTYNFIYDVKKAIEGTHHLLAPGGVLLATVAGISQISRYDMDRWGDYWRFTTLSLKKLFEPVFGNNIQIESYGNVLASCAFLQGIAVEDLPNSNLLDENDPDYQMLITVVAKKV